MDVDHLQSAIFAQNPDMTQDERWLVIKDMKTFGSFLSQTETISIVSEMVIVEDLAFSGYAQFNRIKPLTQSMLMQTATSNDVT